MSMMNSASFSEIEEVGFRVKAARLSRGLGVSAAHKGVMTHVAYVRSEEGRGSLANLVAIADVLNLTVNVELKGKDGKVSNIHLSEIRDAVVAYRESMGFTVAEIAKKMSVPYASVKVFETSNRPQVHSIGRYIRCFGMDFTFSVFDVNNEVVIPGKRLSEGSVMDLQKDLDSALNIVKKLQLESGLGDDIRKMREKKNLSKAYVSRISGINHASLVNAESSNATIVTSQKIVESMGKKLYMVVDGNKVDAKDVQIALDQIRCDRDITPSQLARKIGTTYRTVKIFPTTTPTPSSIKRYADALGVKVVHKIS